MNYNNKNDQDIELLKNKTQKLDSNGNINQNVDLQENTLFNVKEPVELGDVATRKFVENSVKVANQKTQKINQEGDFKKDISANLNAIKDVKDPVDNQDVATKKYVDDKGGGTTTIKTNNVLLTDSNTESSNPTNTNQEQVNIENKNKTQKLNSDGDIAQTINMDGVSLIKNSGNAVDSQDLVTKGQVDAITAPIATNTSKTQKLSNSGDFNADIDANNNTIKNLKYPVDSQDVATKKYVDDKGGGTTTIKTNNVLLTDSNTESSNPTNTNQEQVNIENKNKTQKLNSDGDIVNSINLNNQILFNTPDPTEEDHVANKKYVDNKVTASGTIKIEQVAEKELLFPGSTWILPKALKFNQFLSIEVTAHTNINYQFPFFSTKAGIQIKSYPVTNRTTAGRLNDNISISYEPYHASWEHKTTIRYYDRQLTNSDSIKIIIYEIKIV